VVATDVAGSRTLGATVVKQWLPYYLGLALLSGAASLLYAPLSLPTSTPQNFAIHFYQHAIGKLDGRSCPAYPVCSVYAREAFNHHTPLIASWLIIDRLIHEADDLKHEQGFLFEGEPRLYDPLQRNDFWLTEK